MSNEVSLEGKMREVGEVRERESRQGVSVRICKTFKTDLGLPHFVVDF